MNNYLNWITSCSVYRIQIAFASWEQMNDECCRSGENETGGILIGYYSDDESSAIVMEALPPPNDSSSGKNWFHRGVAGLSKLLVKRWNSDPRTYYIGEWHYHPANIVEPSQEDLAQMHIVSSEPHFCCQDPLMIIVGKAIEHGERLIRVFVFPNGKRMIEFGKVDELHPV